MAKTFTEPPESGHPARDYSIKSKVLLWILSALFILQAQTTPDQRRVDFEQLAASVSKTYAPYQWKMDAFGYDALQLKPWLDRVANAKDDLEYYEICMEYVASLRDLHSAYFLPSDFTAELPIYVDLYDGKPLIEYIDRFELPQSRYPFQIGDELISVDGVTAQQWIEKVSKLQSFANPRATQRWALDQIAYRVQAALPRAHEIGDSARVVIKRASTVAEETYLIPWFKLGTPFTTIGPVATPKRAAKPQLQSSEPRTSESGSRRDTLTTRRTPAPKRLRGFGATAPVFTLPSNFVLRRADSIYSGSYQSVGYRIGYLRIPQFPSGGSGTAMLRAIDTEVAWLRANTDGLVLDVMRNPGGDVCLTNEALRRFINYPFRTVGDEIRPTLEIVQWFRDDAEAGVTAGVDPVTQIFLDGFLHDVETAYREYRGITGQIPVCGFSLDLQPMPEAYNKPMIVLIDEFSTSSGDVFPAVLQDAGRALMVGMATAGGGGLSLDYPVGFYTEGSVVLSYSLGTRSREYQKPGLPPAPYIENIGALPDIEINYMTRQNLLTGGKDFVEAFTQAMVDQIRRSTAP